MSPRLHVFKISSMYKGDRVIDMDTHIGSNFDVQ